MYVLRDAWSRFQAKSMEVGTKEIIRGYARASGVEIRHLYVHIDPKTGKGVYEVLAEDGPQDVQRFNQLLKNDPVLRELARKSSQ